MFCYIVPTTIDGFPTRQLSKRATVKPVYNDHPQKDRKLVFKTHRLMQVKNIAECSKGSILQYFRPSLSYHLSLRTLFCLYMSGRFAQVLLYMHSLRQMQTARPLTYRFELKSRLQNLHIFILQSSISFSECQSSSETSSFNNCLERPNQLYVRGEFNKSSGFGIFLYISRNTFF